ncbi:MAG TPA: sigma-70 family RNA polymerase sigma factor [Terriglobia bacterium]|nr:sigma-70 family RNA polymerase sigma factor [Terriglobia bacterium]
MEITATGQPVQEETRLIQLGLKGNQSALEALFARHSGALYQSALKLLGNHEDAEDALQEGMLAAFKNLRRFEGRSKFSSWLTRIVINAALMRLRSQRVRQTVSMDDTLGDTGLTMAEQFADPAPDPEALSAQVELRQMLEQNLDELPADMRTAVVLRDVEGLSTQEAAQQLGVPENTLKSRLHRARLQLAERIRSGRARRAKGADKMMTPAMCC